MIKVNEPDLLAIFISKEQAELIKSGTISDNLITLFSEKCNKIFPNLRVFSNYNLDFTNLNTIDSEYELDFLLKVSQFLSPSKSGDKDIDEIYFAYFKGIYPLLDLELSSNIIERHKRFISQYSFSENIPSGIIPTLISREFVSTLPDKLEIHFHEYLLKNINNYDTEIYYESPDMRNLRLDFSLQSYRSIQLTKSLIQLDKSIKYSEIYKTLKQNPEFFRGAPSYLEIELFRGCEYNCTFCPRVSLSKDEDGSFIKLSEFQKILGEMESFNSKYTICLGGMGEPFHHPDIFSVIENSINSNFCKELIIETALYFNIIPLVNFLQKISKEKKDKLVFIINFTTINEKSFQNLYPGSKESVNSILEKINILKNHIEKNSLYVQMLKIKELETEVEEYFNFFEKISIPVILQKYNSYAGKLLEKRVSNLTPINREFCWHLARDIYIRSNGSVSACKQSETTVIGNIHSQSLNEIWKENSQRFAFSFRDNHSEIGLPCLTCDEWYTFNG